MADADRLISLCLCTYRRPEGLRLALRSLLDQALPQGYRAEFIVADSDPQQSAAATLASHFTPQELQRVQLIKPRSSGVSYSRNACLDAAQGEIICFIDDDEQARPGWLLHLVRTMEQSGAPIVVGPVIPCFGAPVPRWLQASGVHAVRTAATGSYVSWKSAGTGNVAMRRTVIAQGQRFDPLFSATGGEDSYFFAQLEKEGRRIVHCAEAVADETVPAERLTRRWVLLRALHGGRNYVRVMRHLSNSRATYLTLGLRGMVTALVLVVPAALLALVQHPQHLRWASRVAGGLGKVVAVAYGRGRYGG